MMTGALWALVAGVGFGLFQTVNRRAVREMEVVLATFLQLVTSAIVLVVASVVSEDVSRIVRAPPAALVNFGLAGLLHFFVGWTLLNGSQKLIGAARTSPLISTTPLFATLFAAVALREVPDSLALLGIGVVVAGALLISSDRPDGEHVASGAASPWRGPAMGVGAALCWAMSPIFIRRGLSELMSPLLGVTVGLLVSVVAYAVAIVVRPGALAVAVSADAWLSKITAGGLVGLSTWARWIALSLAPVGVVLAIAQISVPVVLLLSPVVVGRHLERVTARILVGAAGTVGGSLVLILSRR